MIKQGMVTEKQPENIWASLSAEEKSDLYERWKQLGWSQGRFCKKHGLPLDMFNGWCKQMEGMQQSDFCEVTLATPTRSDVMTVELTFSNQITARIQANEQQFGFLLREMLHATSIIR
jgi:hypothetical protein